jgi:hypothetical protein
MEHKDNLKLYMGIVTYMIEDRDVVLLVAKNKEEAKEKLEKWIYEEACNYLNCYLEEIKEVDGHKIKVE